jgi:outer membrane protein OmpA-like peptidoglycan-associated protein
LNDTYNYLSLGLNFNLGKKAIEPMWWINPLDYVYGEISNRRKMPKLSFDDADGDGVVDQLDREPNTPAGAAVDTHGVARDTDGDGVPDFRDKQMVTPTDCQPVDVDGVGKCTDPECCKNPRPVVADCPSNYPSLSFKSNSADLSSDAKALLASAANKMKANPSCSVTIAGYPEASKASQALCIKRTDAVKNFLVQKQGISVDRISTSCEIGGGDKNTLDIKAN